MADTKEQLLQYFSGLDVSTLQRLVKYSKMLIIPEEDLLVNATMSQMVDKAHSLADALFPEWTDRSKSDFGEFLVELFAVFSEKDFWYINAFANESILRKSRSYSNVFSRASTMGYLPTTCKGSSATFTVTFSAGEEVSYERGDLVIAVGGKYFSNDTAFSVEKASTEITKQLTLSEGDQSIEDVTYNGYSIFLRKENIDVDSISVVIDNVNYTRVNNFGFSAPDSTHYMVLPEEDGSCSIYFGSNGYGIQPPIGKTISVEYRRCNGSDGNMGISVAEVNDSLSSRKATIVVMISPAVNGEYAESITSIKESAPLYFRSKKAAINEEVSQDILNNFPFVHKSKVLLVGNEVTYRIIPSSGFLEPTSSELKAISEEFHPCLMAGYYGAYAPNSYKNLMTAASPHASKIIADVIISSGYNMETIEGNIRQIMNDLTNPLIKAEYGGTFSKTEADVLMRSSISGVQSVTFKIMNGTVEQVMPDVTLNPSEIFRPINPEDLIVRINVV